MTLDDYDFELPEEQIAQVPSERRDRSRLLVLKRSSGTIQDRDFSDLPELLEPRDILVLNNTRVFPARLRGRRQPSGGACELLLVRSVDERIWDALARPGRRLQAGAEMEFGDGRLRAVVLDVLSDGRRRVRLDSQAPLWEVLDEVGEPPLPPYIRRPQGARLLDRERYQTVYASERGAVAAPTAGLHFTPDLLARIRDAGIAIVEITLHVGYGTFEPVRARDLSHHSVASEAYVIPETSALAVQGAREDGGRVVAVGTTTTRALESASLPDGSVRAGRGWAELTITPGYQFNVVDALITNFHLPRSSLLVMVGTFAGRERLLHAYRHAVQNRYRFFSYGDAMFIE